MPATPRAAALPFAWAERARERFLRRTPSDGPEVTLAHARIYILPSRRGLAVIGTLATMLVASLNYGLALGLAVTFLLSGLVGAALLHTFRNLAGLTVRPGRSGETFAGGRVPFTLGLEPGGRDRAALEISARGSSPVVADTPLDSISTVTLEVDAPARGRVPLGRITVASAYPLGLWRGWSYVHFALEGVAYASPEPSAPALPPGLPAEGDALRAGSGDAELAGLREFQRGDPMQRVAWKAVARGGVAGTRRSSKAPGAAGRWRSTTRRSRGRSASRAAYTRLTAWVLACERAGRPFALALPGFGLNAASGRDHRRAALTALALFDLSDAPAGRRGRQ